MAKIKILMAGGRRCGKSTILYNMHKESDLMLRHDKNDDTQTDLFRLLLDTRNIIKITSAQDFLIELFSEAGGYNRYLDFPGDDTPSSDISTVRMELKPTNIFGESLSLEFADVPGEWFDGECSLKPDLGKEKYNLCVDLMKKSDVIILAIDTPSMIEAGGSYFEYFNRYENISKALKTALSYGQSDKLILFVPVKCEKYIIDPSNGGVMKGGIQNVTDMVKKRYDKLLYFLKDDSMNQRFTVAITPISSIREIRWSRFKLFDRNSGNELRVYDEATGLPVTVDKKDTGRLLTSFYSFNDALYDAAIENGPTSKYCEQPLVYTLVYSLRLSQTKQTFWSKLFMCQKHYGEEIERLRKRKMERDNGFQILSNPLGI